MELPKQLFKDSRNWFIKRVQSNNSFYEFKGLEPVQFQNLLKRLFKGITKKYPELQGDELNSLVFNALKDTVEFADNNGYSLTALNLTTKFYNIMEHIRNGQLDKRNKGFNPNQNTWINTLAKNHIHTGTNELLNKGVRQIGDGTARGNTRGGNNGVD